MKTQFKRDSTQNSTKLHLDQYYTPNDVAIHCIDTAYKVIGKENITTILEPSAGTGSFSNNISNCEAYDLEPKAYGVIQADFLLLDIDYKKGRLVIGNPPFGSRGNLMQKFCKKSFAIADYVAFILPINQMNNVVSIYEFDLIHSEDLGVKEYSDRKVHCCFNIYTRPKNGLNPKPNLKIDWIKIYRDDQDGYKSVEYDFAICRRGNVGTLRTERLETQTYKIKVMDSTKIEEVKNTILNFDWHNFKKHQSAPSLSKNDIYRLFTFHITIG